MGNELSDENLNTNHESLLLQSSKSKFNLNYKGVKDDDELSFDSKNETKSNSDSNLSTTVHTDYETNKRVPYTFIWREGGEQVTLTGNFASWKQFFNMSKNKDGNFTCTIPLNKEQIQFKFIIDHVWKCSSDYETINDGHNNINNVIDLTNFKDEEEEKKKSSKKLINISEDYNNNLEINRNQFKLHPPNCPFAYKNVFNTVHNENQKKIGKKKFFDYKKYQFNIDENNSFKKLINPLHVHVNHMQNGIYNKNNYTRIGITTRHRQKYTTTIYIKPKNKK
jgi:hypothetical protein